MNFSNRIKVTGSAGAGDVILGPPIASFRAFPAGETTYTILGDGNSWEVGVGTVTGATLTRDAVQDNHLGTTSHINFTAESIQIAQVITGAITNDTETHKSDLTIHYTEASIDKYSQGEVDTLLSTKEDSIGTKNTAFNKNFGSIADTVTEGNDARLSDNRDPNAHDQPATTITYDNASSGLTAMEVQAALDEIVSSSGIVEFAAVADHIAAAPEDIHLDVNAMDWTGHNYANGTALKILPNYSVTFANGQGVSYSWLGPKDITVGLGGNYSTVAGDFQAIGVGAHNTLGGRGEPDAHPLDSITGLETALDAKEDTVTPLTAYNKNFGTTATEVCVGNDARLSDDRDPLAHTHTESEISDLDKYDQTQIDGFLATKEPVINPKNTSFNKNYGSSPDTVCQGDDARLSDTRDPNAHNQDISTINNLQTELDAKEPEINPKLDAFNSAFGNSSDTVCEGNDSRLSDARTPVAHQHDAIDITGESWLLNIVEDVTPELGGNLDTKGNVIALGDGSGGYEGVLINLGTEKGCALAYSSDGIYDANNGAIVCKP
ncbi:MAG: hypothetical protein DRQ46_07940, partial [Gammaproteobacteria bacterium]